MKNESSESLKKLQSESHDDSNIHFILKLHFLSDVYNNRLSEVKKCIREFKTLVDNNELIEIIQDTLSCLKEDVNNSNDSVVYCERIIKLLKIDESSEKSVDTNS